jgi:spore coat protein U-like protein
MTDKQQANKSLNGACLCVLVLLLFSSVGSVAKPADHLGMANLKNVTLGTWTGVGSLGTTTNFCLSSADNDSPKPPPSASTMPYQVKMENVSGPGGDYYLYLNGDTSATGSSRIRISVYHRDLLEGGGEELLTYGVYDNHSHLGQFRNCQLNGNNSETRLSISASEMTGKVSGSYEGTFALTATGGSSGTATGMDTFRIAVTIQAGPEVQISSLNDLSLGSHAGLGNIYAEENFCVYSTSTSGSYSLAVSSVNQDGSGNFYMDSIGGLGQIPYNLLFIDSGSGPGATSVSNTSLSGFGDSADPFCNGLNNATLSVTIQESDLQSASSGSYTDSLVILVSPQ